MSDEILLDAENRRQSSIKEMEASAANFPHIVVPNICPNADPAQADRHPNNRLKTTKYNVLTFLPIQIFMQMTKAINLFYGLNLALNCIPSIGTGSLAASIIPLAFVIFLAILKDFIAEIIRWREDKKFNSTVVKRLVKAGVSY